MPEGSARQGRTIWIIVIFGIGHHLSDPQLARCRLLIWLTVEVTHCRTHGISFNSGVIYISSQMEWKKTFVRRSFCNLRTEDLISMLNTTDGRVPSTSPTRSAVHVREESPVNSAVPTAPAGVQPVPLRLTAPNLSAEPVVRAAQTPPLAPRPLTSVLAGTPGAPGRLGKPFQRLVVHASTGQLPGQVPGRNWRDYRWI